MNSALVTGASSGIGREIALQLASDGHNVVLTARRRPLLDELARQIERTTSSSAAVIPADLSEPQGAAALVEAVRSQDLEIDYLVNNAGVTVEGRYLDKSWEAHRAFTQLTALAPAELIHELLPAMVAAGSGSVLNVASLGAFWPSFPGITLYAGSKSFLVRLTNTLAVEYARSGVKFSVVCPFTVRTAFLDGPTITPIVEKMPRFMIQSPEDVARIAIDATAEGRTIVHTSGLNHSLAALLSVLPGRLVNRGLVKFMALGNKDLG